MKARLQLVILLLSFAALVAGGYLGYRIFAPDLGPGVSGPEEQAPAEKEAEEAEVEAEVTLPEELQEEMTRSVERQRSLFEEALARYRAGEYEPAAFRFRRVLASAGNDQFAARSYRYLGDINARRERFERAVKLYDFSLAIIDTAPEVYYSRGKVHQKTAEHDAALTDFNSAIKLEERPVFYLARGGYYFGTDNYDSAIADYSAGLEGKGHEASLLINRGLAYQRQDEVVKALSDYQRAREYSLSGADKYRLAMNLGKLYLEDNQPTEALEEFKRARELKATSKAFYNLALARLEVGDTTAAISSLEQAREEELAVKDSLIQLGYLYQQTGQYEPAIEAYKAALERSDRKTRLIFAIGRLYELRNDPRTALRYYRRVMETEPGKAYQQQIWRRMGELGLKLGELENVAIPAFKNVLKLAPSAPEPRYNLGVSYFRAGDLDQAVAAFREALAEAPERLIYREGLARALYWNGQRKEARSQFEEILARKPDHFKAAYMLGFIDYEWGKMKAARNRFDTLLKKVQNEKQRAILQQNLGNVEMRLQNLDPAVKHFRRSLKIRELPESYYNISLIFLQREMWDRALSALEKARESTDNNARVRTALGYVLYNKGLYREAENHLQQAVKFNPQSLRARYDLQRVQAELESAGTDE